MFREKDRRYRQHIGQIHQILVPEMARVMKNNPGDIAELAHMLADAIQKWPAEHRESMQNTWLYTLVRDAIASARTQSRPVGERRQPPG